MDKLNYTYKTHNIHHTLNKDELKVKFNYNKKVAQPF